MRFVGYYASRDKVCISVSSIYWCASAGTGCIISLCAAAHVYDLSSVCVQTARMCHHFACRELQCVISLCADSYKSAVCVWMAVTSSVCVRKLQCAITLCVDSYNGLVCAQIALIRHQGVCKQLHCMIILFANSYTMSTVCVHIAILCHQFVCR